MVSTVCVPSFQPDSGRLAKMGFWKSYGVQFSGLAGGAVVSTIALILTLAPAHIPCKAWFWFFTAIGFVVAAGWRVARELQKTITKLKGELETLRSTPILHGTCELSKVQHYPWADQTRTGAWLSLSLKIWRVSGPDVYLDHAEVSVMDRSGDVHIAGEVKPKQFDAMRVLTQGQALSLALGCGVLTMDEVDIATCAVTMFDTLGRRYELQTITQTASGD